MKKTLSLILAFCLIFTIFPMTILASSEPELVLDIENVVVAEDATTATVIVSAVENPVLLA